MCGICGVVTTASTTPVEERVLLAMRDAMEHRGPDDAGQISLPGVALGSRRLSILDLSEQGHMPMGTSDGRYRISYNGEVYNYRELRAGLEARGFHFRSNTDTEVILYLYADQGPSMLARLNGMFAIAIWDMQTRSLFLARDRLGIKPLYYSQCEDRLHFASEEKALFSAGVPARFDPATWEELMLFRYVAGESTPFKDVKRLLPGHYLLWHDGQINITRWWHLAERAQSLRDEYHTDPLVWYQDTFDNSVALRRISDVPVGVLLSGGLDSGSVAASLASQAGSNVASFTVRFEDPRYDEGPLAQQVASSWHLDYHELRVSPNRLLDYLFRASWLNDEPLAHGNDLHLLAISEYAKPHVTVLLSGEGADETLGGYVRYQPLRHPALLAAARPVLPQAVSAFRIDGRVGKLSRFLKMGSIDRFVLFNACELLPNDLQRLGVNSSALFPYREAMLAEARSLYPNQPVRQAMYSDQHTFLCSILDRNDRMTMGASIECRVPYLDYRLVEGVAALPSSVLFAEGKGKALLRRTAARRLPPEIQRQHKWGFAVPWTQHFRQVPALRERVANLAEEEPVRSGPFGRKAVREVVRSFLRGEPGNDAIIRQLVMVAVWYEACVRSQALVA